MAVFLPRLVRSFISVPPQFMWRESTLYQSEELQSNKRKSKITVDPNTLFANVDRIEQALEQATKAKVEAEAQKPQQITNATTLGQREEEELKELQIHWRTRR
jgi:hypothetical protein